MTAVSPEFVRATHDAQHRRLVAEADAQRLRRRVRAAPTNGGRGDARVSIRARVRRPWARPDGKVDRLRASWLAPDGRAASRLAGLADVVDVPAGTTFTGGRFVYIGLDGDDAGFVAGADTPPFALTSQSAVLVMTTDALQEMLHRIPALGEAWSRARTSIAQDRADGPTAEPTPPPNTTPRGDRCVHHPHRPAIHARPRARRSTQPQTSGTGSPDAC